MDSILTFLGDNVFWFIISTIIFTLALIGNLSVKKGDQIEKKLNKVSHIAKPTFNVNELENETVKNISINSEEIKTTNESYDQPLMVEENNQSTFEVK